MPILHLLVLLLSARTAFSDGLADCPCWNEVDLSAFMTNGKLFYKPVPGGPSYEYPANFGMNTCKAHDQGLPPFCDGSLPPPWCLSSWCYVNPRGCSGVAMSKSAFFTTSNQLYFSYATCGSSNTYMLWQSSQTTDGMESLDQQVDNYLASTRLQVQSAFTAFDGNASLDSCAGERPANLCQNRQGTHWKYNRHVDFTKAGSWLNPSTAPANQKSISCLFGAVEDTYLKVGTKEGDADGGRYGFLYMADQSFGSYMQWPDMEWCPAQGFDPRLRAWYANGATSPKDVLIVVDVSGSMGTAGRHALAKAAVLAVLKTVTFKDFVGIVLFNSVVSEVYSNVLVPGSEDNVNAMTAWTNSPSRSWQRGGTNFRAALGKVFDILGQSIAAGQTSACQKMILFMTDGLPGSWTDADYVRVQQQATERGAIIMTYALGSGASTDITKKLACQNKGVFEQVSDGADLASIMSRYYNYFASGQHLCTASTLKYTDVVSKDELYTSCLPIYKFKDEGGTASLLGVTCMDYSVIADVADLKKQEGFQNWIIRISDRTKMCKPLEQNECDRQRFRRSVSPQSVCLASDSGGFDGTQTCPCVDPNCKDNEEFVDEQGYFCDLWIGDDCSKAVSQWQYSQAGMLAVQNQCKKSCGLCNYGQQYCSTKRTCPESVSTAQSMRVCRGKISGADITGRKMCCPTDTACINSATSSSSSSGSSGAASSSSSSGSSGFPIVIVIIIAVVALVGGGGALFCFCKMQKSSSAAPSKAPTKVHPVGSSSVPLSVPPTGIGSHGGRASASAGSESGDTFKRKVGTPLPPQPVPTEWTNQSATFSKIVPIDTHTQELQNLLDQTYKHVKTRDRGDRKMPKRLEIVSVKRNENRQLWQSYCEAKTAIKNQRHHKCTPLSRMNGGEAVTNQQLKAMRSTMYQGIDEGVNEVMLWHGTSPKGMEAICQGGFKMKNAGTFAGMMYGPGGYFAECSSKSDEYGRDDSEGVFAGLNCLLLCRVVLGELMCIQVAGDSVHKTIEVAMQSQMWNAVLGDRQAAVGTYREFVVYAEDQIYPEYAILYKRKYD